jgi:HAD superfamily hydrolase (TIGR01509 family)
MTGLVDILAGQLHRPAARTANGSNSSRRLQALLFDAGDILYFRPYKRRRFHAFLHELGLTPAPHSAQEAILHAQAYSGQMSRDEYIKALVRLQGVQDRQQVERGQLILEEDEGDVQFFDGVKETLLALKQQGLMLGIITNTAQPVSAKLGWFERAGIGHIWDAIISSQEIGVCKPDPQIYQAALRQLGLHPGEAAFVAHDAAELDGARQVSMITIAFNYDNGAQADFYLKHFSDLRKLPLIA